MIRTSLGLAKIVFYRIEKGWLAIEQMGRTSGAKLCPFVDLIVF